ncbi:DUF262 domain-containing protein [Alteribacter natronophilus]|uniref:DUF262 domain-containing protein n=1 Tax=Alteribacter natronophilus TaxID=2583810 RepID=UPI00110EE4E1|nr:DUF262 domain-containing protein [Alteribacter natronophilus]TMW72763.1 DUF262 domain-containing protein [Alteribacter natronophilus]
MSNYQVNNTNINALVSWIEQGVVAIPEIQRPFVWKSSKVRDLLDSLYNDYPVGYIITWQNPDARLKDGTISQGKRILIDGQQRVTAIMAAISGKEVVTKEYSKRRIKIAFNPIEEIFEVQNPAITKDKKWIPDISDIFQQGFDLFGFISRYCEQNPEVTNNRLNEILQKLINIRYSSIGVIELAHTLDIEKVTEIFIRINSSGVNLSQADFAMSKVSVNDQYEGPLIRKTVDYFCHLIKSPAIYENIKENDQEFAQTDNFKKIEWVKSYNTNIYEPSYSDLLRVAFTFKFLRGRLSNLVSLLSGRDFETREYKEEIAEESFEKLNDGVLKFVNETNFKRFIIILKSAGVINSKLVRSQNALNFTYALFLLLREKRIHDAKINQIVRKWLVASVLTERYSGSPESTFDFDIKRFAASDDPVNYVKRVEDGELSDAYWENVLPTNLDTSVTSSPYFNLYVMAQIYDKDYAFLSKSITVQQLIEERGDVHHVFPKKYLQNNGYNNRRQYNQIANYAYTEQAVNLAIRAQAPKDYMEKIKNQIRTGELTIGEISDNEGLDKNFRMNCIPESVLDMDVNNYEEFLDERRKLIAKKIRNYYENL